MDFPPKKLFSSHNNNNDDDDDIVGEEERKVTLFYYHCFFTRIKIRPRMILIDSSSSSRPLVYVFIKVTRFG